MGLFEGQDRRGVPEHRVRVAVGATIRPGDVPGTQRVGGHAWPMYRTATGGWCVLETSLRGLAGRDAPRRVGRPRT